MGKRLYVGGLPFATTEDELHSMFSALGQIVSVKLIMDRDTGQSKGFAFVEMNNEDEAQAAIQKFNGTTIGARQITVNEARPMENRGPAKDFRRSGGGGGGQGRKGSFRR